MKASEHFNLPLSAGDHEVIAERVYQNADYDHIAEFNTPEQAMIAARAINHADKLADALEACMNIIGLAAWRDDCYKQEHEQAIKALESYRSAR